MVGSALYIGKLKFANCHSFKGNNLIGLLDKENQLYQWTVFLGNNNTGKTNLLKGIADLEPIENRFGPNDAKFDFVPLNMHRGNKIRYNNRFGASISDNYYGCEIVSVQIDEKSTNVSPFSAKPELYTNHWEFSPLGRWSSYPNIDILNFQIYGYGVSRRISKNGISENSEELNAASLFNPDHKLTNIEEWLFQLKFASQNGQPTAETRLNLIKDLVVSEVFPEILDFRFTTTDDLKNFIEYQTKEGWFLFEELGYGYQTTLSWIIDLCKKMFERYPTSPNPLTEPAVVLVDELDLHLHPKWQKSIVDYLTKNFTSTQFIVTTHSPLLLQTIEKVNLFALIKKENSVLIKHIPTESFEGWSVEEILSEVMEMEEGVFSDKHNALYKEFDEALDKEDYESAKAAFDKLMEILHPKSPERKILKLQLSQITPVDDKA
jgi:AAA15 family ATPase/GTPase